MAAWYNNQVIQANSLEQVTEQAEILLEQINALRTYTVKEVRPLTQLTTNKDETFHPQSVPAYAATQVANLFAETRPEYSYKEAVFNPTNVRDKAAPWEETVINQFINDPDKDKIVGNRIVDSKKSLYIAKPIRITNPACLECHSTPEAAPASMVAQYGSERGFGWELDEIVGTRMIIVPFTLPEKLAGKTFNAILISLGAICLIVLIVFNIVLRSGINARKKAKYSKA